MSLRRAFVAVAEGAWRQWALIRHRAAFDEVDRFCLFVGYPRSGHSLLGAFLNAHRHAVIAHEVDAPPLVLGGCTRDELYARILARAWWFNLNGNHGLHPYQIPNQWQGRFESLRVIGDKRGGAVTRAIAAHPELLERLRKLVRVPIRLFHVVRNPFDNIAGIAWLRGYTLEESIDYYFDHCATTAKLGTLCSADELLTCRHEAMVRDPAASLAEACTFLGLDADPQFLRDCASIVYAEPALTRSERTWPAKTVREVERRAREFPFLDGYRYETGD